MTWLLPWWEVRTKVSCDALASVVSDYKPTLKKVSKFQQTFLFRVKKIPRRLCHREVSHNEIVIIVLKSKGYGII